MVKSTQQGMYPSHDNEEENQVRTLSVLTFTQQMQFAEDLDYIVRRDFAKSSVLLASIQDKLSQDSMRTVRCAVAGNDSLIPRFQERLSEDSERSVRFDLADNLALAPAAQEKLSQDEDESVRYFLARSPVLIPSVQERLSMDSSTTVRQWLGENRHVQATGAFGAQFVRDYAPELYAQLTAGCDAEIVGNLVDGWQKTFDSLVEFANLVTRR